MVAYFERRTSRPAYQSRRLALFDVVLFTTAGLAHRLDLIDTPPFLVVMAIVAALALIALFLGIIGLMQLWDFGYRGGHASAAGLLLSLVLLAPFLFVTYLFYARPQLVDISTDLVDPPRFRAAVLSRTPAMNPLLPPTDEQAMAQAEFYPAAIGRRYEIPADRVYATIYDLAENSGWELYGPPAREFDAPVAHIEGEARTLVFGFRSDVVLRVAEDGDATLVDMRSASRYGVHDLGGNAARIDGFLGSLDDRLGLLPPS